MTSPTPLPRLLALTAGLALCLPGVAWADVVAVTPLLGKGVDAERVGDLFDLMSFELENVTGVDEIIQLEPAPTALTTSCVSSTRCLGAITREADADTLLTGTVERRGKELTLDIVYYDAASNQVLRRTSHTLPDDPTAILSEMTPIVTQAVTGVDPRAADAAERMDGVDFGADEGDLDFYAPGSGTGLPEPAPAPVTAPAADAGAFSFGESEAEVTVDFDDSAQVSYGDETVPVAQPLPDYGRAQPVSAPQRGYEVDPLDDPIADDEPLTRGTIGANTTPTTRDRTASSSTRSTTDKPMGGTSEDLPRVTLTAKGGYTFYSPFNFGTIGGELGLRAIGGLHFAVGVDLYIVRRQLPPELIEAGRPAVESNFIVPINAGLLYKFNPGRVKPYLGADFIFAQYYLDPTTNANKFAFGGRARGGADIMLTSNFGFNVDVAVGMWAGQDWDSVDPRAKSSGFLPHASVGFVLAF